MSAYKVAHLDDLEEVNDSRCPFRPVRHHLGISAFGTNAWTAAEEGDRLMPEHEEDEGGHILLHLQVPRVGVSKEGLS